VYLAEKKTNGETSYVIRESLSYRDHYIYRDLFDLGTEPKRFIHYPGGHGYYYDPCIEEALVSHGVEFESDELDKLLFEFLEPEIQRVIAGFDRGYRKQSNRPHLTAFSTVPPIHIFDKRRFHYLRFGHSQQRYILNVPEKIFLPLQGKSRDELEHYFNSEERKLRYHQKGAYLSTIFRLNEFNSDANHDYLSQIDAYFIDRLCRLNRDKHFLAGEPHPHGLYGHLIKYVIFYFDFNPLQYNSSWQYIADFMNRHSTYRPSAKTMAGIKEAEQLFGYSWKALKRMDRTNLTSVYRRLALKHHPDQGGDAEKFSRITRYYRALIEKKPRK
jgi:hypothetical protein